MPSCPPHTLAYHSFSNDEVQDIRCHLLAWYRANRRRLPWRGDAPPYASAEKLQQRQQTQPHDEDAQNSGSTESSSTRARTLTSYFTPLASAANKRRKPSPQPTPPPALNPLPAPPPAPAVVSAYGVWVSEVMLQQTRVSVVVDYWTRWMARFPSVDALAAAQLDDVNSCWSGLGYYRRAKLLHEAAQHVHSTLHGRLPDTVSGLLAIPGIGPYTAGAVASIAYGRPVPLVDGNVQRVLSRLRALHASPKLPAAIALHWQLAQRLVGGGDESEVSADASDWNQALMELGAVVCMPRVAECGSCPVRRWCRAAEEVAERRRPAGGERWRAERRMVEVEVEVDVVEAGRPRKRDRITVVTEQKEAHENGEAVVKRRGGSGKASSKQPKCIALDDSLCSICQPRAAAPETVLEYPSKAERKPPTDQHVSVCVVSRSRADSGYGEQGRTEWLLVQRPAAGLLAGQWEFPAVLHAEARAKSKPASSPPPTPTAGQRRELLLDGLQALLPGPLAALVASAVREPVGEYTHVFSHRRHLMHVQRCVLPERAGGEAGEGEGGDGRRWRWMTEGEMGSTGLTSGQRRVWALSRGAKVAATTGGAKQRARPKLNTETHEADECESGDDEAGGEAEGEEWEVWPAAAAAGVDMNSVDADGAIVID